MGTNGASRIEQYFRGAKTCPGEERRLGIEVETLITTSRGDAIGRQASRAIWQTLREEFGWQARGQNGAPASRLVKEGFTLTHELGWNNHELISPVYPIGARDLFARVEALKEELGRAAARHGCRTRDLGCDQATDDTLSLGDERDRIWLDLDGEVLRWLGHIASVHFNIDLCSVEEGFAFIAQLNGAYAGWGWPAEQNAAYWRTYITRSRAGYQEDRYGPAPSSAADYFAALEAYPAHMNRTNGQVFRLDPAVPFAGLEAPDIDLFLRSVWWWQQLRVRAGRLVLEIRDVPRELALAESWGMVKGCLGL